MAKTIKAQIISSNTINADIISDANINANIKGPSNLNAYMNTIASATTTKKGTIRIATDEEAILGVADNLAITPHTLRLATFYIHEQGIASDTWVINHNLNKRPSFEVVDSAYTVQLPSEVIYNSDNQMTMIFISSFSGYAYLN